MADTPNRFDAAQVITTHQVGVWRYLRALGCEAALADDLTQETFLYVLSRPFQDYSPAATATYLRRVARSLFVTVLRREAKIINASDLGEDPTARATSDRTATVAYGVEVPGSSSGPPGERSAGISSGNGRDPLQHKHHPERHWASGGLLQSAEPWDELSLDALDQSFARLASDGGAELLDALRRCLETLGDRARKSLDLRFAEQCSRQEIAAQLGMTEDGAKNLMQRAKKHLKVCIEGRLEGRITPP